MKKEGIDKVTEMVNKEVKPFQEVKNALLNSQLLMAMYMAR